jgi:PKD repeat protein
MSMKTVLKQVAIAGLAAGIGVSACVHKAEEPPLAGPSGLARSLTISVTPDHLTQDGSSQASVSVQAIGPSGAPMSGVPIRVDTLVGGTLTDYGTLAARTIVTGSDGVARTTYTAPAPAPPPDDSTVNTVSVRAVQIGTDAQAANPVSAMISLIPRGVILPPADTPVPNFAFAPGSPTVGAPVTFDGSPSTGVTPIVTYAWSFGDGSSGSGMAVTHTFGSASSYLVTLTVTNSRGVAASKSQIVAVAPAALPQAQFVSSPGSPNAGQPVQFTDNSTPVTGRTNVGFDWNFGDPTSASNTASGRSVTHTFATAGSYTVVLTVTDDLGQKSTATASITVK